MTLACLPDVMAEIRGRDQIKGTDPYGGFSYDLDLGKPWLAAAIHAGHGLRPELHSQTVISEKERLKEEDPATERIIQGCSSTVWGLDSRAEYDLNRAPKGAVPFTPEMFWGLRVYDPPPDEATIRQSLEKYERFYAFIGTLLTALLQRHGACVVYDVHSYNIGRQVAKGHRRPPEFNVGTRLLNHERWRDAIRGWKSRLAEISLTGKKITAAENVVFGGEGEFCRRLTQWDANILVLPTEIAKVYMDEESGEIYNPVVEELKQEFGRAVADHGRKFQKIYCL